MCHQYDLDDLKIHEIQSNIEQALDDTHNINKEDVNELC